MSKCSKFLENELDKVHNYLNMAKATLIVPIETCNANGNNISESTDKIDTVIINYLKEKLPSIELQIEELEKIIKDFKNFYIENLN